MRKMGVILGCALFGAAVACAQPVERSTTDMLNQRVEEVTFEELPLDQVIEWLTDYTQVNVDVRWQQLDELGVERTKPISLRVKRLRLSQVLYMIMKQAAGPETKLAYRASGNLLVISTAEDLGQEMLVKVYDVSDLLVRVPSFRNAPRIDLSQQQQQGGGGGFGGGGGGGQGIFGQGGGGSGSNQDPDDQIGQGGQGDEQQNVQMDRLIQLIINTIEPDTWIQNAGDGTIQAFGRQLVVRNNILVHQALGGPVEDTFAE